MADLTALEDVNHYWGQDIAASASGDVARVSREVRSKQRVYRRLMTNPGEYIFHPTYGYGLGRKIGQNIDLKEIQGGIRGQMLLEPSVARTPPPVVEVREFAQGGVAVKLSYTALPDKQPVSLSFRVEP